MERNKLETQFKEKLNSREIKPSEMAWDRLDAMLTVVEDKKSKRNFSWIYIAASILGFVFLGTFFFNQKGRLVENEKNKIVIQQSIPTKSNGGPLKALNPNSEKTKSAAVVAGKVDVKTNKIPILKKDSLTNNNNLNQNQVAELSIINQKNEQESNSSQTKAVTVDELLARVDKSARLKGKTNPNLEVYVNANQLLQQVENDLEPTFRQSVFSKIVENVKVVKEAVVNRNKE
ncbi:MAG: hypothetical protein H7Y10_12480 [Flavobacterium sp.]|nr:hypothetical protein [Flavobacterium sp.]